MQKVLLLEYCENVLPLFLQFHTPELVYASSVYLIPPCNPLFLQCALMEFIFT